MNERAVELVSGVARDLRDQLLELTPQMAAMFIDRIPEFRHDETVQRLMEASTESNLSAVIDMLMLGIPLQDISVPPAAAHYARRFAQHDMPLDALLRAYRLGEQMLLEWFIDDLERRDVATAEALRATRHIAAVSNGYIDQIIAELSEIYQDERQRWEQRSDSARAAEIRTVLNADDLEESTAEEMLGMSLSGWYVGAIIWSAPAGDAGALRAVNRILTELTGRPPLIIFADSATVWAWLRFPAEPAIDATALEKRLEEHPDLAIALGDPGTGLAGFRHSHAEAVRARHVAEIHGQTEQQVHQHSQSALAGLLLDQRENVRTWVHRTLGKLAADDDSAARLRDTLRVFLELNGSFIDTAARMHVHKNTVLYRLRKAEEILGRPISDGRLSIEVALHLCDQLALATPTPVAGSGS